MILGRSNILIWINKEIIVKICKLTIIKKKSGQLPQHLNNNYYPGYTNMIIKIMIKTI